MRTSWFSPECKEALEYVHAILVNCLFKLVEEKVWSGELLVPHVHSCLLGTKCNEINKSKKKLSQKGVILFSFTPSTNKSFSVITSAFCIFSKINHS